MAASNNTQEHKLRQKDTRAETATGAATEAGSINKGGNERQKGKCTHQQHQLLLRRAFAAASLRIHVSNSNNNSISNKILLSMEPQQRVQLAMVLRTIALGYCYRHWGKHGEATFEQETEALVYAKREVKDMLKRIDVDELQSLEIPADDSKKDDDEKKDTARKVTKKKKPSGADAAAAEAAADAWAKRRKSAK